jgi:hypothetical protein
MKFDLINSDHAKQNPTWRHPVGDKRAGLIIFSTQATWYLKSSLTNGRIDHA